MTLITRRAVLLAKEEGTYGTDPTPVAASNAFEVISDLSINPAGNLNERAPFSNSLSPAQPLLGQRWYEISFVVELRGSGSEGTAPQAIGDLLESCGMAETVVGGASVTYDPASSSIKSCTIYAYLDGLQHQFHGCRGNVRLLLNTGETAKLEFTMMGKYEAPTDVAIASPTYDSTVPPVVLDSSFTFDSDATLLAQNLELDLGSVVSTRPDFNETTGIEGFAITAREGGGSFNPEAELIAGYDFWTIWTASTQKALSVVVGATAGNICTITCPKVVLEGLGYGDREGVRIFDIPFKLSRDSGDDEIAIAFT